MTQCLNDFPTTVYFDLSQIVLIVRVPLAKMKKKKHYTNIKIKMKNQSAFFIYSFRKANGREHDL